MKIGLLVTCLVDLFRPQVGFSAIQLLEEAGCTVVVPKQTCCGQPAYNSGDRKSAKKIAWQVVQAFKNVDYVVVPSGSCAGMLVKHYPDLFSDDAEKREAAKTLAAKTYELTSFLTEVLRVNDLNAEYPHSVTYHDSCSGLRELGIKAQPRLLLNAVKGVRVTELPESEVCCGFGGTFCVKYPKISDKIVSDKVNHIQSTKADTLLAGDMGCLMNMARKLKRCGSKVKVMHVAEVLANQGDKPGIGENRDL